MFFLEVQHKKIYSIYTKPDAGGSPLNEIQHAVFGLPSAFKTHH